jgi:hypothetical protein
MTQNQALFEQSAKQLQLLETQQAQIVALQTERAAGSGVAKFKIPRPKSATKLLHTYDNILLDARTKWESATVDRQKLVEIIAAFEARTPDPSGRDPQIPDGWRVKLPKLACMDGETLLRNRTEQDGTFRLTQLGQLKAILDCITKDVEIKHAGIA